MNNMNKTIASFILLSIIFNGTTIEAHRPSTPWKQGVTTRYWDCCKPSCGWWGKADFTKPVLSCDKYGNPLAYSAKSGCENGGQAFTCPDQQPFNVSNTLSYGFAAVRIQNKAERDWCCKCYRLKFNHPFLKGKEMIVQATNTGYDLNHNHFDIAMPGGGQGIFQGCTTQFDGKYQGGALYGGVANITQCYGLPSHLIRGCVWRFTWFMNADNPAISWKEEECPPVLLNMTKCRRTKP